MLPSSSHKEGDWKGRADTLTLSPGKGLPLSPQNPTVLLLLLQAKTPHHTEHISSDV